LHAAAGGADFEAGRWDGAGKPSQGPLHRRALGFALIGEAEMPRECLARVREVLDKIGGPL
jgi:hypothetical protein